VNPWAAREFYRGYELKTTVDGAVLIFWFGEFIDSFGSADIARKTIDDYHNAK
jgi:hypothetical protein